MKRIYLFTICIALSACDGRVGMAIAYANKCAFYDLADDTEVSQQRAEDGSMVCTIKSKPRAKGKT